MLYKNSSFRIVSISLIILLVLPCVSSEARRKTAKYRFTARTAIFADINGRTLYARNIHSRVPPASTTKIMTALLVLERLSLDQYVTVS